MKQDKDTQYEILSNSDRAALAFNALCQSDISKAHEITRSVEVKTYKLPEYEYLMRLKSLFMVAGFWSVEFWRCYSEMLLVVVLRDEKDSDNDFRIRKERLVALFLILDTLEQTHMLNVCGE